MNTRFPLFCLLQGRRQAPVIAFCAPFHLCKPQQVGVFDQVWVKFLPSEFRNTTLDEVFHLFYNKPMQDTFSVANLWHDPTHQALFLQENLFLPEYLGLVGSDSERLRRKTNFKRLSLAAFFVGSFANATFDGGRGCRVPLKCCESLRLVLPRKSTFVAFFVCAKQFQVLVLGNQVFSVSMMKIRRLYLWSSSNFLSMIQLGSSR